MAMGYRRRKRPFARAIAKLIIDHRLDLFPGTIIPPGFPEHSHGA